MTGGEEERGIWTGEVMVLVLLASTLRESESIGTVEMEGGRGGLLVVVVGGVVALMVELLVLVVGMMS